MTVQDHVAQYNQIIKDLRAQLTQLKHQVHKQQTAGVGAHKGKDCFL